MKRFTLILFTLSLLFFIRGNSQQVFAGGPETRLTAPQGSLSYYRIGGLLFAGSFPINNPQPTGDTAFAYLYLYEGKEIIPVDSVVFDTLGYFTFDSVVPGKYCLKSGLAKQSARFSQYIPAYYGNELMWADCDTLEIVDHNIFNAHIYLIDATPLDPGPGHIWGALLLDGPRGGTPLENCQVVLADQLGEPLQCTFSGAQGAFRFDSLPAGNYKVFAEYTGMFSQNREVALDTTHPYADSLSVTLFTQLPGIPDWPAPVSVTLYPNPADQQVILQFRLRKPEEFQLSVYNFLGEVLWSETVRYPACQFQKSINLTGYPNNVYLISLRDTRMEWEIIKKFIKI